MLTHRQKEVLDFIGKSIKDRGLPPTSREIQKHFGFRSQTAAMGHIKALKAKGIIKYKPRSHRSIRVMGDEGRWKPVQVPPKSFGLYLVCAPSADPRLPFKHMAFYEPDKKRWFGLVDAWLRNLTHWMPYPKTPHDLS